MADTSRPIEPPSSSSSSAVVSTSPTPVHVEHVYPGRRGAGPRQSESRGQGVRGGPSRTNVRKSVPVTDSASWASTQCAEDPWYTNIANRVPIRVFHDASLAYPAVAGSIQSSSGMRALGEAQFGTGEQVLDRDHALSVLGEGRDHIRDPGAALQQLPSPSSSHIAPVVIAFVHE